MDSPFPHGLKAVAIKAVAIKAVAIKAVAFKAVAFKAVSCLNLEKGRKGEESPPLGVRGGSRGQVNLRMTHIILFTRP